MNDKTRYTSADVGYVGKHFFEFFKVKFQYFFAGFGVMYEPIILIDIGQFDDYLKKKHTNYSDELSMSEFIIQQYGQEAHDFIVKLI